MPIIEKLMWAGLLLSVGASIGVFAMAIFQINKHEDDEP